MAENTNPIKYSDLVKPDNSISDLIKQLDELSDAYTNALRNIRSEAIQLTAILKNVSGATEAGRAATRKASADAEKLARAQRELAFAESENAKKLAELKQAQSEANAINKLLVKINQSAEGSYNRLSAQYSLNKIYLNNMTKEERENTEEGKRLVEQTREIYEEMKRLQEVTGKHQLNVGNYREAGEAVAEYGDRLKEALGLNNTFGESLLTLGRGGDEGKKMFDALKDGAVALGKSLMTLMTNPVFLGIAGIGAAGAGFKWWYDYNSGLVEATRLTQQLTGKEGADLKSFRIEVQSLSDTFGLDFRDTLVAANAVAKQFGISVDEAVSLMQDGLVAGGNVNGEFLDTLKEYPAYFKEAGISADQFIAIVAQTNKAGIFSDKGVDAIKEANLRLREMTPATAAALDGIGISSEKVMAGLRDGSMTTFDVMQMVSGRLNELPASSQAVGAAIADIFGGPGEDAGLQYLKTLGDISTNLDDVKDKGDELGKLQEEQMKSQMELEEALSDLFDMTGGDFETMTTNAKSFVNNGLASLLRGVKDVVDWVRSLYERSMLLRVAWNAVALGVKNAFSIIGNIFKHFVETVKSAGAVLEGVLTLDFDKIKEGYSRALSSLGRLVTESVKDVKDNIGNAIRSVQQTVEPIVVPVEVGDTNKPKPQGGGGNEPKAQGDGGNKPKAKATVARGNDAAKAIAEQRKAVEEAYKRNIEATRSLQDAELRLEADGYGKRVKQTQYYYDRQLEDLQHRLSTQRDLTEREMEAISAEMEALTRERGAALLKLERENAAEEQSHLREAIELRLAAVRKGSAEELRLRQQLLEQERQAELSANSQRPEGSRMSTDDIDAKYEAMMSSLVKEYTGGADALYKDAEERRLAEIKAEQDNIRAILEMVESGEVQMADAEVALLSKRAETLGNEAQGILQKNVKDVVDDAMSLMDGIDIDFSDPVDSMKKMSQAIFDLGSAFSSIGTTEDKIKSLNAVFNMATEALMQYAEAQTAAAEAAVASAEKQVDSAQSKLDAEIEARNNGYANNVELAQKELDMARKNQEAALKEQEKAQKEQEKIQTLQQIGNLVSATALIWAQLGFPWAIPATAVMWSSFAAAKIMAASMAGTSSSEEYGDGTVELLQGGSHQSGNDIDLGTKPDGTRRRAEGGEFFAVINKRSSRRFRKIIPGLVNSLNDGTFPQKYMGMFNGGDTLSVSTMGESPDLAELTDDVRAIRKSGQRRTYVDGRGRTVEIYKNMRRTSR